MDSSMESNISHKPCIKCLLREVNSKDYHEIIIKNLEAIKEEDKVDSNLYDARLNICKECDKLINGTCLACGCYVEIRAALVHGKCPKRKWQ